MVIMMVIMVMIIMVMITMVSLTFADHVNHDKVDDHACTNDYDKDVVDDDEDNGYCDGDNGEEEDHDDGRMVMMKLIMRLMQGHTQKYSQFRMFSYLVYLVYHIGNCVVVSLLYPIQINGISLLVPSELILRTIYMGGSSIFQPRTVPENRNYGMDQKQFSHV